MTTYCDTHGHELDWTMTECVRTCCDWRRMTPANAGDTNGRRRSDAEIKATPDVTARLGIVVDYSPKYFRPYNAGRSTCRPDGRFSGWYRQTGVADCGHRFDNLGEDGKASISSGYAYGESGRTFCYSCIDRLERARALTSDTIDAYLSTDSREITTRTGGRLGVVVDYWVSSSGRHGSEVWSVRARTEDGRTFYGRNGGPGSAIRLRAIKADRVEAGA